MQNPRVYGGVVEKTQSRQRNQPVQRSSDRSKLALLEEPKGQAVETWWVRGEEGMKCSQKGGGQVQMGQSLGARGRVEVGQCLGASF